jgi:hypothetical protein
MIIPIVSQGRTFNVVAVDTRLPESGYRRFWEAAKPSGLNYRKSPLVHLTNRSGATEGEGIDRCAGSAAQHRGRRAQQSVSLPSNFESLGDPLLRASFQKSCASILHVVKSSNCQCERST